MPIEVSFEDFKKIYFVDVLVADGAVFEIKTAEALHARHRAQLLNYLLLLELAHGKLLNFRPEAVQHEFVNTTLLRSDRTTFEVDDRNWQLYDSDTDANIEALHWIHLTRSLVIFRTLRRRNDKE